MLTIYIDFKSPASYLAVKPTLALIERTGVDVIWQPFVTSQREVPKISGNETVGDSHRRVRAASRRAAHIKYAAQQGLDLRFPASPGATDLALGALATLKDNQLPYIQAAFHAYWEEHADLDDPAIVTAMLEKHGGAVPQSDISTFRDVVLKAQTLAEERGIVEAPAYVIADQIFIGREHLPWIEEIIQASLARSGGHEK